MVTVANNAALVASKLTSLAEGHLLYAESCRFYFCSSVAFPSVRRISDGSIPVSDATDTGVLNGVC